MGRISIEFSIGV